jgi:hypothetical protein
MGMDLKFKDVQTIFLITSVIILKTTVNFLIATLSS